MMKFQLAPCHRPPTTMVIIRLRFVVSQEANDFTHCAMRSATAISPAATATTIHEEASPAMINTMIVMAK